MDYDLDNVIFGKFSSSFTIIPVETASWCWVPCSLSVVEINNMTTCEKELSPQKRDHCSIRVNVSMAI